VKPDLSPAPATDGLDLRRVLLSPLRLFAVWLAIVLLVTWVGQPGIVCVTPLAWLIAAWVGIDVATHSKSTEPGRRLVEAGLAGAWFGFLEGILFWVIAPRMGPIQAGEQASAAAIGVLMVVLGMLVGAAASLFTAVLVERRQRVGA
jgi:hypothetical protein